MRLAYAGKQAPLDLLDRITSAEAAVQETLQHLPRRARRPAPRSDNELEDVLRTATDSATLRAAWEARKQIGGVVADDLRRLAELRNEAARANGFPDFWHQQLVLEELDPERLLADAGPGRDTPPARPFEAMKADLDRKLAERFAITVRTSCGPGTTAIRSSRRRPRSSRRPPTRCTRTRTSSASPPETYRELGFANIDAILARSDLYPRPGKNQHAYAVDIDREGDVRTFLNVEPNARWMGTLLHELGHTIYQDGIDRTRPALGPARRSAGLPERRLRHVLRAAAVRPDLAGRSVGLTEPTPSGSRRGLRAQETSALLAFVRWCLTIVHFERAFYADPGQDLNALWWDLEERYQLVPRPEGRDAPDWAAKIHVATAPVYYHKYLYGRLFSAQLAHAT